MESKQLDRISSINDSCIIRTEIYDDNASLVDKKNSIQDLDENYGLEKIYKYNYEQRGNLQREDEYIDENYFSNKMTNQTNDQHIDDTLTANQTIKYVDPQDGIVNKKILNFSSQGNFDSQLFMNNKFDESKKQSNNNNNTQKYNYNSIDSFKQYEITYPQKINFHNLGEDSHLTLYNQNSTNDCSYKCFQQNPSSIESSSIIFFSVDNYSGQKQKQKQQLQGINDNIQLFQSYDINQQHKNSQLEQEFSKNQAGVSYCSELKSNSPSGFEMQNQSLVNLEHQREDENKNKSIENMRQYMQTNQFSNCSYNQLNAFSDEKMEDIIENYECLHHRISDNEYLNNQINQCDEKITCDFYLPEKSEQFHNYQVSCNSLNNYIEYQPKFNDNTSEHQHLLYINNNEHESENKLINFNCLKVENQGVLGTQSFYQQVENNKSQNLNSKQQKQVEQNSLNFFQKLKLESENLQINLQKQEQKNYKQKINQSKQRDDFFSLDNSAIETKSNPLISIDCTTNNLTDSLPHLSKQSSDSCKEFKETSGDEETQQDNKIMNGSDNIVDRIIHLNKKNMVRNIVRAFKKYFLNKKSSPPVPIQCFPNQSLEVSKSEFKAYFNNKKFNNSILKKLITHPQYGQVFHDFLLNKSNEYLDHSNVKAKESHELFVNFLVLCFDDLEKLQHLETYQKLQPI